MAKEALKAKFETGFCIRPNDETTVVRIITDPAHPEYDPRVELPVDENMVNSLIRLGQLQQAVAYKDGMEDGKDIVVLVDGRQRWKAMQEVWNRFLQDGTDMKLAPSFRVVLRGQKNAAQRREIRISANRHRQELSGLALAQELRNHLDIVGESEETLDEARVIFNFPSSDALRNCLALLDTTPAVQEHLASGALSPTGALQLSRQAPEVQDAVASRIAAETEGAALDGEECGTDGDDDSEADDSEPRNDTPVPPPAGKTKPVPVSQVKEMIRDATGKKSFEMVTLKQLEKEIDKKERQLESAISKLEECNGPYDKKFPERSAKVAEVRGYIDALRWARGETSVASAEGPTNDKASAAWDALRDALTTAAWPKILSAADFPAIPAPWGPDVTPEQRSDIFELRRKRDEEIRESKVLVVAGERVAFRNGGGIVIDEIRIDTSTKWFQRLMDPFGIPSSLVRDFGAHGWLAGKTDIGSTSSWKSSFYTLAKGKTTILLADAQAAKWAASSPEFGHVATPEDLVRRIVSEHVSRMASEIRREDRFGSPWFGVDIEDETAGPDLGEDRDSRESIRDDLESALDIDIGDDACTWGTVGDLIDYVEGRQQAKASEVGTDGAA